jgi:hypothetical protein
MRHHPTRLIVLAALALVAIALTACGGSSKPAAAPGSPERPLQAQLSEPGSGATGGRSNEGAASSSASAEAPGYQALVKKQSSHPRSRFTPCNLVTPAQARAILGSPVLDPIEAPQGPTCIYRSRNGKSFVTVALQSIDFKKKVKPHLKLRQRVAVSSRTAYCGTYGQPMLYLPLSGGRVLAVGAHCAVAKQFAIKAVRQLSA